MLSELSVCCSDFTCSIKSTNWKKKNWWNTWISVFYSVIPDNILQLESACINAGLNDSNGSYTLLKRENFIQIKKP